MSSRPRRRVSLPNGKKYHFNVIYNNAKSKLSKTPDTELSLKVTEYFIDLAKDWGYDQSYYVERDALPGQNVFTELFHVIDSSLFTIVILTPGFLSNCWARYCQQSAFKSLLDSEDSDPASATSKMIPVLIDISDKQLLRSLNLNRYGSFTRTDWKTDKKEWGIVKQMMKDKTAVPGQVNSYQDVHTSSKQPIQETETPVYVQAVTGAEATPSLSQFNRPETDGPSSSNVGRQQREVSGRDKVERSSNAQQAAVGKSSAPIQTATPNSDKSALANPSRTLSDKSPAPTSHAQATGSTKNNQVSRETTAQKLSSSIGQTNGTQKTERQDREKSQQTLVGGSVSSTTTKEEPPTGGKTVGQVSTMGKDLAGNKTPASSNQIKPSQKPTQEQDLLRREIISSPQVSIQAEQASTTYSNLPAQQFISSPTSPRGPSITMPAEVAVNVKSGRAPEKQESPLQSRNLSNDAPTLTQAKSAKVLPLEDISGKLRKNSPLSEETQVKQVDNKDVSIKSTVSPTSDSGIGSTVTTPSLSLDPYTAMQYHFPESGLSLSATQEKVSVEPVTTSRQETTFDSQPSSPPVTQITHNNARQDNSETFRKQLANNTSASPSISNGSSRAVESDNHQQPNSILDSVGSLQNQSDLDLDQGSFPSGDGQQTNSEVGGPSDETAREDNQSARGDNQSARGDNQSARGDQQSARGNQQSARGDNQSARGDTIPAEEKLPKTEPAESLSVKSECNTSSVLLSSSTSPFDENEAKLIFDKEENVTQKFLESNTSEEVYKDQIDDKCVQTSKHAVSLGSKPQTYNAAVGLEKSKVGDDSGIKSPAAKVNNLTNGKPRTRRASMSDLARPAMNFIGSWIWKPALHVITGSDQLYI
ncbi:uncharacterized protein [Argopecten irradians]|uniref:uncharacterized protein n=1 Tax=Argopecten irradians TaxID=31199 RepID=UPI003718B17B